MVEFTKTIKDPLGLHARPVALLYDIIAKHRSDVSVGIGDRHTDGRDVMGLMALYGECGEDIIFRVSGVDEAPALRRSETSRSNLNNVTKGQSPLLHQLVWQGAAKRQSLRAYRTKCVSTLGASAQVDAPFQPFKFRAHF